MRVPEPGLLRRAALVACVLLLTGCATTGERTPGDPLEPMNREVFRFNSAVDRGALRPAATAYHDHTPGWFQTGVGNFFNNLTYPVTVVNQVLQGKLVAAGQDLLRFAINTTLGWGGVLDVASGARLPQHDEDLGQTLGKWGVPPGAYLTIPLLGPSTVRDLPSDVVDRVLSPLFWFNIGNAKWGSLVLSTVDKRSRLLPLDATLDRAYDKYAFVRNAYLQRRRFLIYDGNPPEEPLDTEFEVEPETDETATAPGTSP